MKKLRVILPIFILMVITIKLHSQPSNAIKLIATVVTDESAVAQIYEIQVSVEGGKPAYIFQLFDKAPWDGGIELAKSNSLGTSYIFKKLSSKSYFVCVTDNDGNSDCEIISISKD